MVRVDTWVVCQWCISNKVLEHAIDVRTNVKKLTDAVASTRITHVDDVRQAKEAEARLRAAQEELEAAIKNLATISADSHHSLEESLAAVEQLQNYRSLETESTRKAREGSR